MTLIQLTIVFGMRAVYNLYVGKFNKEDVGLSKKKVVLDDIVSKLRRINESDGYVTKFYQSPTEYKKLKKEGESEPYERPYEKKLVERGLPTDNKVSEEVLKYYFQTDERLRKNDDLNTVLVKVTLVSMTAADRRSKTFVVYFLYSLHHFKEPCSAGYAVCLQRGRYGKTDGFLCSRGIGNNQIGSKRIKVTFDAFHARIKRFQINCDINTIHVTTSSFSELSLFVCFRLL